MNYYEIGQRIRHYRKAKGLSQEELAYASDISVTHMSHIETENTKLSLPVLVKIAKTLNVHTDALLYDSVELNSTVASKKVQSIIDSCTSEQACVMIDVLESLRESMNKHIK